MEPISVKDKLPKFGERVLFYQNADWTESGWLIGSMGYYSPSSRTIEYKQWEVSRAGISGFECECDSFSEDEVTHWMPLPPNPTKE